MRGNIIGRAPNPLYLLACRDWVMPWPELHFFAFRVSHFAVGVGVGGGLGYCQRIIPAPPQRLGTIDIRGLAEGVVMARDHLPSDLISTVLCYLNLIPSFVIVSIALSFDDGLVSMVHGQVGYYLRYLGFAIVAICPLINFTAFWHIITNPKIQLLGSRVKKKMTKKA